MDTNTNITMTEEQLAMLLNNVFMLTLGYINDKVSELKDLIANHDHPVGTRIKFAENAWDADGAPNLIPDTDNWIMSNGLTPTTSGSYSFETMFTGQWEAFTCFFDEELINTIKGNNILFGIDYLHGEACRLELVIDGQMAKGIVATDIPSDMEVHIPSDATSVSLRIIVFKSISDMYCSFSGVHLYDKADYEANLIGDGSYLKIRKIMQDNLPAIGIKGTMYITDMAGLYITGPNGKLVTISPPDTRSRIIDS